jgi:hypothetical protein
MKKLTFIVALAVAALATVGMKRHPGNPQMTQAKVLPSPTKAWPLPICPPNCSDR